MFFTLLQLTDYWYNTPDFKLKTFVIIGCLILQKEVIYYMNKSSIISGGLSRLY